ncbi:sigma 54-interacting transcriptional regulator [Soonwooa sp.]|uniref:sigma 54-interacting transcriptional regulator n=1 Tax=Soonwooa sp. TaxID=1938592 RepID=UPI0028AC202E|nr:sigma 54-interacting transcriptional regulator [Soonwooa sp.]
MPDKAGKIENFDGGMVFLDEIENLSLPLQQKLLTLIQTKKLSRIGETKERFPNDRFLFATNAELRTMVAEGKFREDLYLRINTVEVNLPPLRDRMKIFPLYCRFYCFTNRLLDEVSDSNE